MSEWKFIEDGFVYFQDTFQLQNRGRTKIPSAVPSDIILVTAINSTHLLVETPQECPSRSLGSNPIPPVQNSGLTRGWTNLKICHRALDELINPPAYLIAFPLLANFIKAISALGPLLLEKGQWATTQALL